ncbi:recombinase family protein [Nocardia salmonicida]|uniref:recombinase family protein n=1 Tax=Nocardia salmonicida TaxID=53431 RepID=UPI003CF98456
MTRSGVAWSKSAVRSILANPRYTGHEVWNKQRKQRKQESLIDVDDVALGHHKGWPGTPKPTGSTLTTPFTMRSSTRKFRAGPGGLRHTKPALTAPHHPPDPPVRLQGTHHTSELRAQDAGQLVPRRGGLPLPLSP